MISIQFNALTYPTLFSVLQRHAGSNFLMSLFKPSPPPSGAGKRFQRTSFFTLGNKNSHSSFSCKITFNYEQTSTRTTYCSSMRNLGTHCTQTYLILSLSVTNVWVAPNDICKFSDSACNVIRWPCLRKALVVLILTSVSAVIGSPEPSSFEVDCLLYLNILKNLLGVL